MKTYRYNRLVRDNSDEFLASKGVSSQAIVVSGKRYQRALQEKLVEEAAEVFEATSCENLIEELADVQELLLAMYKAFDIDPTEIESCREQKTAARGSFQGGCFVENMHVEHGSPADHYLGSAGLEVVSNE